jgi:aspartyl-tRNA(Asn)/glutamyl-tRNA(Gln) amidotransferase subunit C
MTSTSLTREDVLHIARLAHLDLSLEEAERFTTELGAILAYASEIQRVETTNVAPMSHASAGAEGEAATTMVGRDDEPEPCLDRTVALSNAPDAADGLFRVPKVRG